MKDNHAYIVSICNQLKAKGLVPSVALIRGKATHNLPIPDVIKVLQQWKQDPDAFKEVIEVNEPEVPALSLEQRVEALEKQVAALQTLLDARS